MSVAIWLHCGLLLSSAAVVLEVEVDDTVLLQVRGPTSTGPRAGYSLGQRVEAKDHEDSVWRPGEVVSLGPLRVRLDGWLSGYDWQDVRNIEPRSTQPESLARLAERGRPETASNVSDVPSSASAMLAAARCAPQCQWTCDSPKCDAVCEPVCEAPVCETRCGEADLSACEMRCDQPHCAVLCPKATCPSGCPGCSTSCSPPRCMLSCPEAQPCRNVCEQPRCEWRCRAPSVCPKPSCHLSCDAPSCGAAIYESLPPLEPGETSVRAFDADHSSDLALDRPMTVRAVHHDPAAGVLERELLVPCKQTNVVAHVRQAAPTAPLQQRLDLQGVGLHKTLAAVNVRATPELSGARLKTLPAGSLVIGVAEGDWLRLLGDETGFIIIKSDGQMVVTPVQTNYASILADGPLVSARPGGLDTGQGFAPEPQTWRLRLSANVRSEKDTASELLGVKDAGTILRGVDEGEWLRLTDERGFILSHNRIEPADGGVRTWRLMLPGRVLAKPDLLATVLGFKEKESLVHGIDAGDWVRLSDETGFLVKQLGAVAAVIAVPDSAWEFESGPPLAKSQAEDPLSTGATLATGSLDLY